MVKDEGADVLLDLKLRLDGEDDGVTYVLVLVEDVERFDHAHLRDVDFHWLC